MKFSEIIAQASDLLRDAGRITYRALKREFALDDEMLEDLKEELIVARRVAHDEDNKVLVWTGEGGKGETVKGGNGETEVVHSQSTVLGPQPPAAERRQLTVMFCDLVGSTALSTHLDPEELRDLVRAYQGTCEAVISRYEGHIAQYLGDGLLVYFGYPVAHEDDAVRAIRAGVDIIHALKGQGAENGNQGQREPLQVRIGIHTGVVVVGEIGGGTRQEQLALGDTPNLAARLQGLATPDTVVVSAVTQQLAKGFFLWRDVGPQTLKGIATPVTVYQVLGESGLQSRFEVAVQTGLTLFVGREEELALLRRRWQQTTDGEGQVVLLSGEAGIGKSRLVQELREQIVDTSAVRIEFRCSPYHHHSALYPIIEYVQHRLNFTPSDTPHTKLHKLQHTLAQYRFPQPDTFPLLAAFLSLPHPDATEALTLTPQQQKQKTLDVLAHWLFEEAERGPVYMVCEDLHWADPSTIEFLTLCVDQVPTVRMLMVVTFRPEVPPTWAARSHISHLVLSRLGRQQTSAIVAQIAGGNALSSDMLQQIVAKTDGVPLFVEELAKMVVETKSDREGQRVGSLPLGIPSTLQDALMARLDRLGTAKEVAQQAAVIGRELTYELLRALSPLTDAALPQELRKLVDAELLYQRGRPPHATYLFKHALVQDTAYQSLLKSQRQHYHRQIAQVFEEQFPDAIETQPELVAHHYTEAGLGAQAIPYWQQAGQRAAQSSANTEAITHLTKGLDLLAGVPDTPERHHQELALLTALGPALIATKGNAASEVEQTYARAVELCRHEGETLQLFPVLFGLRSVYLVRGEVQRAHDLGEQLLSLAKHAQDSGFLLEAQIALGNTLFLRGEWALAQEQFELALKIYDPEHHQSHAFIYGLDPRVFSLGRLCQILWFRGYPDQGFQKARDMLSFAREVSHSFSSAFAGICGAGVHFFRRESLMTLQHAEETISLCAENRFAGFLGQVMMFRGWARTEQGLHQEGIVQIRQGLAACQATGAGLFLPWYLVFLASACWKAVLTEDGLGTVAEALAAVDKIGERYNEAELYRLKGELTLQKGVGSWGLETSSSSDQAPSLKPPVPVEIAEEAEGYFLKAIAIAQSQQAKSWELRAATSLARLWQQQDKRTEAHKMLSEVYKWFTEGFDTKDLQEAKAVLEELRP